MGDTLELSREESLIIHIAVHPHFHILLSRQRRHCDLSSLSKFNTSASSQDTTHSAGGRRIVSNHGKWEANIECDNTLQIFDLLGSQLDAESLDIVLEMLDFPPADNGEDLGCFSNHIGQGNSRDRLDSMLLGDLNHRGVKVSERIYGRKKKKEGTHHGQSLRNTYVGFGLLAEVAATAAKGFALLLAFLQRLLCLVHASAQYSPGSQGHAKVLGHWDDVTLKRAIREAPFALIDAEGRLSILYRIRVGGRDDPSGRVRDA